jgi:hypothetical protein
MEILCMLAATLLNLPLVPVQKHLENKPRWHKLDSNRQWQLYEKPQAKQWAMETGVFDYDWHPAPIIFIKLLV